MRYLVAIMSMLAACSAASAKKPFDSASADWGLPNVDVTLRGYLDGAYGHTGLPTRPLRGADLDGMLNDPNFPSIIDTPSFDDAIGHTGVPTRPAPINDDFQQLPSVPSPGAGVLLFAGLAMRRRRNHTTTPIRPSHTTQPTLPSHTSVPTRPGAPAGGH